MEHERRWFAEHAAGRRVERVVIADPAIVRNASSIDVDRALRGRTFGPPDRKGKWLIAWTDGPALLLHFGMTGRLIWAPNDEGRHHHDRAVVVLDDGEIRYRNMRKLGGLWLAHGHQDVERLLEPLGPDALGLSRDAFLDRLGAFRGQVKPALLGQRLVSGVGNLIADEVLWQARIHPARRIGDLSGPARNRLQASLQEVLETAVASEDYVRQGTDWLVHVRGDPGARCPRCGTRLARSTVGGRTTYHCSRCQR